MPPRYARLRRLAALACASGLLAGQLLQVADAAPSQTARAASAECLEALLRRLGWTIQRAAVSEPVLKRGEPCTRGTLAQAQASGDLHLTLPADWNTHQRGAALTAVLDDAATHCAYAFELGAATRRAVTQLQNNPRYRFSALQLGWVGFGWRGAAAQGWSGFRSFGRGYQPRGSNARALDAFYRGQVRSECGVGRQVAQLATQRELFGDAGFDEVF
ncbi:hypothetical protein ACWA5J_21470, partial [Xanthomonas axonopodis pv. ricini]